MPTPDQGWSRLPADIQEAILDGKYQKNYTPAVTTTATAPAVTIEQRPPAITENLEQAMTIQKQSPSGR